MVPSLASNQHNIHKSDILLARSVSFCNITSLNHEAFTRLFEIFTNAIKTNPFD